MTWLMFIDSEAYVFCQMQALGYVSGKVGFDNLMVIIHNNIV